MGEGRNESEAVRAALVESAGRRRRRSSLVAEVATLAADAADSRERTAVMEDMDNLESEWPD